MQIHPYLTFDGQCREALEFYARCLGGTAQMETFGGSPAESQVPAEWHSRIMHGRVESGSAMLMGSDSMPDQQASRGGFAVSVSLATADQAREIFDRLKEGAEIQMDFGPTFWTRGFGFLTDRFGVEWMVSCEEPPEA